MNFQVYSRVDAQKATRDKNLPKCIIISITTPYTPQADLYPHKNIVEILRLSFLDLPLPQPGTMTNKDAKKIVSFVDTYYREVDTIVVHCEAGFSRSAGVAKALMEWLNGEENLTGNPRYSPNPLCYMLTKEAIDDYLNAQKVIEENL